MKTQSPLKFSIIFFLLYAFLLSSLIFYAMNFSNTNSQKNYVKTNEVSSTFSQELKLYEEKKQKEMKQDSQKWKPSRAFVITAIGISSVLDIIIILLWARHENKKRAVDSTNVHGKKWSNSPRFWKLVSMGMLEMSNGKINVNWKNTITFFVLILLLKFVLTKTIMS